MAAIMKLDMWKIFTVVLGCLVMPLAGWVWTMNVEVAQLRNDMGDLESVVAKQDEQLAELDDATRIRVESDVQHIRSTLGRIENLVTR